MCGTNASFLIQVKEATFFRKENHAIQISLSPLFFFSSINVCGHPLYKKVLTQIGIVPISARDFGCNLGSKWDTSRKPRWWLAGYVKMRWGIEVMKSLASCDFCSCKSKSDCHEGSGFGEWERKQQLMTVMQLRLALGFIFIAIQPSGQQY